MKSRIVKSQKLLIIVNMNATNHSIVLETDRHTDRQTDTQTDRQTHRQTDRHTDRQTDTDRQSETNLAITSY